jgi:hypothetical protein
MGSVKEENERLHAMLTDLDNIEVRVLALLACHTTRWLLLLSPLAFLIRRIRLLFQFAHSPFSFPLAIHFLESAMLSSSVRVHIKFLSSPFPSLPSTLHLTHLFSFVLSSAPTS